MATIDKHIPLPVRATNKPRSEKYPEIRMLEIGDSILLPIGTSAMANHTRRITKATGHRFVIRLVADAAGKVLGTRVWRKE